MKKIDLFYVQVFGEYTNSCITRLLGEDADEAICTKRVVATGDDIKVYRLSPVHMKQVLESVTSASLVIQVYHDTRLGLVHVADLVKALDAHVTFTPRSSNPTVTRTKAQLATALACRKQPLATV